MTDFLFQCQPDFIAVPKDSLIRSTSILSIKPGPKPIAKSTGKEDKRQRVTPENKPKHKPLKIHKHKKNE